MTFKYMGVCVRCSYERCDSRSGERTCFDAQSEVVLVRVHLCHGRGSRANRCRDTGERRGSRRKVTGVKSVVARTLGGSILAFTRGLTGTRSNFGLKI